MVADYKLGINLLLKLKKNRLLKELDLSHNNFGDEGGKFLGQFICNLV